MSRESFTLGSPRGGSREGDACAVIAASAAAIVVVAAAAVAAAAAAAAAANSTRAEHAQKAGYELFTCDTAGGSIERRAGCGGRSHTEEEMVAARLY